MSTETQKVDVLALDFESYAAQRGSSMADVGDAGAHKRGRRQTDKQWARIIATIEEKTESAIRFRNKIRSEYEEAISRGEIRPLNRQERLQIAAAGHPDLESTQAAKRILEKQALARVGGAK